MARTYEREREHKWKQRGIQGVSYAQYEQMRHMQGNKCGICSQHVNGNGRLDHDHVTGAPRGVLCNTCNLALGHLEQFILSGHVDAYLQLSGMLPETDTPDTPPGDIGNMNKREEEDHVV